MKILAPILFGLFVLFTGAAVNAGEGASTDELRSQQQHERHKARMEEQREMRAERDRMRRVQAAEIIMGKSGKK